MKDGQKLDNKQRGSELQTEIMEYAKVGDTKDLPMAGVMCKGKFTLYFQSCLSNFSQEDLLSEMVRVAAAAVG